MTNLTELQRSVIARIRASAPARRTARIASAARGGIVGGGKGIEWRLAARELAPDLRGTTTSRSRVAARYAMLAGVTLADAAELFELSRHTVCAAWKKIYPGVPGAVCRRTR